MAGVQYGRLGPIDPNVEKVALRLCQLAGYNDDSFVTNSKTSAGPHGAIIVGNVYPTWSMFVAEARAALDEMGLLKEDADDESEEP